jgi:hypothetical protein
VIEKGVSRKESSVAPKPIYTTCSVNTKDDWCVCCTPKPCIYTTYTLWTPEIIDVNTRDITPRQIVVDKQTKKQQKDFFKQLQRKPHKAGTLELCKLSHCRKTCTKFNLMLSGAVIRSCPTFWSWLRKLSHCQVTCQKPKCKKIVQWWGIVANSCRKHKEKERRLA